MINRKGSIGGISVVVISLFLISTSFMLVSVTGCAANRPPLADSGVETGDRVIVSVTPAGPNIWVYSFQSMNKVNLKTVDFISNNLKGCKVLAVPDLVERAQEKTSEGIRVSLHPSINKGGSNPFQRMSLILVSDTPRQAGNIRIRVTDIQDKETLVESIAGPQIRKSPTSRGLAHRSWRTIEFGPQFVDRMPDNLVRINSLIGL